MRVDSKIFVSKRNVDIRNMGANNMVAVNLFTDRMVEYYGENKPSVDTPIQVQLYNIYPNVNFMLHTHAYVEGAPFTTGSPVPCGSLEEVGKIWDIMPWENSTSFAINLKGHGSILFMSEFTEMTKFKLTPKPMPENM